MKLIGEKIIEGLDMKNWINASFFFLTRLYYSFGPKCNLGGASTFVLKTSWAFFMRKDCFQNKSKFITGYHFTKNMNITIH